jgi:hypothetical protein
VNYQDFESAWYLGLIITSFFAIMLTGFWMAMRRVRQLFVAGDTMSGWLAMGASFFTFIFFLALCLSLLILLVVGGSA